MNIHSGNSVGVKSKAASTKCIPGAKGHVSLCFGFDLVEISGCLEVSGVQKVSIQEGFVILERSGQFRTRPN